MPRGDNFRKKAATANAAPSAAVLAKLAESGLANALTPEVAHALRIEGARLLSERMLEQYRPYTKQLAFHAAGRTHRERLLMAGNQLGKTWSAGAEVAMHLTGDYPDWWPGRRFDKPVVVWAGGVTGEATRDTVQRVLMGRKEQIGTGMIPARSIIGTSSARGIADALDTVTVRHRSGGTSHLLFKSYEKGREKWQGDTVHIVWFDEEPPIDIYSEGLTRTNATGGIALMTFTPLLGMSEVVELFYPAPSTRDRHLTMMTIEDAEHYSPEQRARVIASYAAHERDARAKGIPILGSGRVFAEVAESDITVPAFTVPPYWPQIGGIDFGWDHPTAGVRLVWDRDTDTVYVTAAYRVSEKTPVLHAAALKPWGHWLPWAWPHDGLQHDKGSGEQLANQYRAAGLNMLPERATFPDGSSGLEAGVSDLLMRMQTGRLKVFSHLEDWFQEFRLYHRKEGLIVKKRDDLLSATRYGVMMMRYAVTTYHHRGPIKRNLSGVY
jgi:phage terminase large subunit-like protein